MITAWSHLPNARHIDRILADIRINPESWHAAWHAAMDAAWDAAWNAARGAAINAAWDAARPEARDAAWNAARPEARAAILALIAWDESSEYLNLSRDQVQVLSLLGDKKAMLLLPAVLAFEQSKELV